MFDKLYHRANSPASFRPIAHSILELECFVHGRATTTDNKKLRSKAVVMHAYSVSVYYACTRSQLNRLGQSHSKWAQRSSDCWNLLLITRAASSSMPKKLKRWVNIVVRPAVLNTYKRCRSRACIRWHIPMHAIFAVFLSVFLTCSI